MGIYEMKMLPALLLVWVGGFLIGYSVRGNTETYMESEAALIEAEQAGMARMARTFNETLIGKGCGND